eukprot:6481678-Amphidinium_carterae.1
MARTMHSLGGTSPTSSGNNGTVDSTRFQTAALERTSDVLSTPCAKGSVLLTGSVQVTERSSELKCTWFNFADASSSSRSMKNDPAMAKLAPPIGPSGTKASDEDGN